MLCFVFYFVHDKMYTFMPHIGIAAFEIHTLMKIIESNCNCLQAVHMLVSCFNSVLAFLCECMVCEYEFCKTVLTADVYI